MQSKSSISISSAIIKENIRRFWGASLAVLILLLVSSVLPYIFSWGNKYGQMTALGDFFTLYSTLVVACVLIFPLVIGVAVFRYLHRTGSLSIIHSFPFTRATLFLSNFVSGLILIFSPIIATALMLLLITPFGFKHFKTNMLIEDYSLYIPDWSDLIIWLVTALVISLFIYAITIFAGFITGNSAMHVIVAILMNVIVPAFYSLILYFFQTFLFGFNGDEVQFISSYLHPYTGLSLFGEGGIVATLMYIVIAVLIVFIAFILYRILKVERAGDAFTFRLAEYIIVFLVTLLGMSGVGFIIASVSFYTMYSMPAKIIFYISCLFGAIVTFLLASMIGRKTFKIFDMGLIKRFGIFAIIAVLFLTITTGDVTGFQKYVPNPEKEGLKVSISKSFTNVIPYKYGYRYTMNPIIMDQSLELVTDLHKEIVNNRAKYIGSDESGAAGIYSTDDLILDGTESGVMSDSLEFIEEETTPITLNYTAKNNYFVSRKYDYLSTNALLKSDAYKNLITSETFIDATSIEKWLGYKNLMRLNVANEFVGVSENGPILNGDALRELAKCLDADRKKLSFEDMTTKDELLTFDIRYKITVDGEPSEESLMYTITEKFTTSIDWLKKNGYYDDMIKADEELKKEYKEWFNGFE